MNKSSRRRPLVERVALLVYQRACGREAAHLFDDRKRYRSTAAECLADARRIVRMVREHDRRKR